MTPKQLADQVAQELIRQLKANRDTMAIINAVAEKRHTDPHKLELFRQWKNGNMPESVVRECGLNLLSRHPGDRTEAVDTIFSYTSPYGRHFMGGVRFGKGGLDDG
jgi:hypothetical protein